MIDLVEQAAREEMKALRAGLLEDPGAREVYQSLFPKGLSFSVLDVGERHRVWAISGMARLGCTSDGDPNGI